MALINNQYIHSHCVHVCIFIAFLNSKLVKQKPKLVANVLLLSQMKCGLTVCSPLPSNRHHRSCGDRLEGKGKTIRSVLCNIVCNNCAQCDAHTYEQTNSSLDWVLSHWPHFTVLRFIFACIMCIIVYCLHV